ncbi:MAG: hypothetical protein ABI944_00455, partial [Chthoniobacterales bacterium]
VRIISVEGMQIKTFAQVSDLSCPAREPTIEEGFLLSRNAAEFRCKRASPHSDIGTALAVSSSFSALVYATSAHRNVQIMDQTMPSFIRPASLIMP